MSQAKLQSETIAPAPPTHAALDALSVNAVRFLALDAVERAGSGHPGTAMALAPLGYRLYTRYLRHDPSDPTWPDRDRLVLSAGHASMLLYASLHLSGYELGLDDLAHFRQWDSRTPAHPERLLTPGIDMSTGPLGQGLANAVGLAMSERMLAARYNDSSTALFDHRTWAIVGDGDMMEGVTGEAASLAGHLQLGKLTAFYDDNKISLEGPTSLHFSEDVARRFRSYGWHVVDSCAVNDLDALDAAVQESRSDPRPSLIVLHSHIGYGTPRQDSSAAHGSPIGVEGTKETRDQLGWHHPPFTVPDEVYARWRSQIAVRSAASRDWSDLLSSYEETHPDLAAELSRRLSGQLPADWDSGVPTFEPDTSIATRVASGTVMNAFAKNVPELISGAADVGTSTGSYLSESADVTAEDWSGRNIHFGVREHAMGSIANGLAAHGGFRPCVATFFVFADYMRPAIRMAAIMRLPTIFLFTHDSIGVGEDGMTHQPVEQLAGLRAIPNLVVLRPADANETARAWRIAMRRIDGPTALVLTRQAIPVLAPQPAHDASGAVALRPGEDATILASGSEVEVAMAAHELLCDDSICARVVSVLSMELLRAAPAEERNRLIPPDAPTVAVEAASPFGWHEWADEIVGIERFGASAAADVLYREFGVTPEAVADSIRRLVQGTPQRTEEQR